MERKQVYWNQYMITTVRGGGSMSVSSKVLKNLQNKGMVKSIDEITTMTTMSLEKDIRNFDGLVIDGKCVPHG